MADVTCKPCKKCGEVKTLDEFYADTSGAYGRRADCKVCVRRARSDHRRANPEKVNATNRNWAAKNRDKETARTSSWRRANPEKSREYTRRSAAKSPELNRARNARRRAAARGAQLGTVSYKAVRAMYDDCYLCGNALSGTIHIDHVWPLSRGGAHTNGNLRPSHELCNLRKGDRLLSELDWYQGPTDIGQHTAS